MAVIKGNGLGNLSSNPGRGRLHFTWLKYACKKYETNSVSG